MPNNQHYEAGTEEADRKDAEIARLRAALEEAQDSAEGFSAICEVRIAAKDKLIAELVEALREAGDELDAYYKGEYPTDTPYHVQKLKVAMDGNPARAALSRAKEQQT